MAVLKTTFIDRQWRGALLAVVVGRRLLGVRRGLQVDAAPVATDSLQEVAHGGERLGQEHKTVELFIRGGRGRGWGRTERR